MSRDLLPFRCGKVALAILRLQYVIHVSDTGVDSHPNISLGMGEADVRCTFIGSLQAIRAEFSSGDWI